MLSYDTLESTVTIASVRTPLGPMHVAALPSGVCAAVFDDRYQALEPRLRRMFGPYFSVSVGDPLDVARRIDAYFGGTLDALRAVPLAIAATPMQRRVWALVSALSPGALVTYAALADRLGMPRAQRAVGVCLATNPAPLFIPCHRVVAASGSLASYPGGVVRKRWLLRHEKAVDVADLTGRRALRARRALDPRETVDVVAWPRMVG
ncbi:MAG TPA: methylated-DNA--[protein]-cysteine S-methyltransferase [Casimicrobiaceae bacterium]|nr:methylated-DNA--[protein]-cysteine S-methyltransferase [Casimicrobiaceae bacterium]